MSAFGGTVAFFGWLLFGFGLAGLAFRISGGDWRYVWPIVVLWVGTAMMRLGGAIVSQEQQEREQIKALGKSSRLN